MSNALCHCLLRALGAFAHAPFFDEFIKSELFEHIVQLWLIVLAPLRILGRKLYRRIGVYRCKLIG